MNRIIKFRVWNEAVGMINEIKLEAAHGIRLVSLNDLAPHEASDDRWVFMQYTDLKDKNDKEIYEGDVVKILSWQDDARMEIRIPEIYGYLARNNFAMEVIGNVWENPELLK